MSNFRFAPALVLALFTGSASDAFAHGVEDGRNGGTVADVGKYHAELVVDGTPKVTVYLSDPGGEPVDSAGFKANAILMVGGKPQRFALEPAEGSRLVGTAPVPVAAGVKGVVQLTAPDGTTAQGKF